MKKILFALLLLTSSIFSKTKDEILNEISSKKIISVDFVFSDISGNIKSVKIPSGSVRSILENGLKFDGSSVPGCSDITSSDMHLAPDLSTWRLLPSVLTKNSQGVIICDVCLSEDEPYLGDPRQMLKNTSSVLKNNNLKLITGIELEFYLLDKDGNPCDKDHYFDFSKDSKINDLINIFFESFVEFNLNIVKEHHEVSTGQFEFVIGHSEALNVADQVILAKYLISAIAQKYGFTANFMAKPIYGINGSGMHIHFSLFDEKNNLNTFYDPGKELYLSETALSFIAGNLKYIRDLSALFNGSVNSYKRLVPGYEAPIFICWGSKNRSSLIRIPLVNKEDAFAVRAEIRCPDPLCNPYLALNALAISGIKGIEEKLEPTQATTYNLYKLNVDQIKALKIQSLPESLRESIACFAQSEFVKTNLNQIFVRQFLNLKLNELRAFETAVTDWELKTYS